MRGGNLPERPDSDKRQAANTDEIVWYARFAGIALSKLNRGFDKEASARFLTASAIRLLAAMTSREKAAEHALGVLSSLPPGSDHA